MVGSGLCSILMAMTVRAASQGCSKTKAFCAVEGVFSDRFLGFHFEGARLGKVDETDEADTARLTL